jgi:MFS superfamily sulfate permease-like transporter
LIAALFTLFVVLFASGLLRNLPQPVLAAIVLAAVLSLVNVHALKEIWRFSRSEFLITAVAFVGVLGSGPANGVLIGAGLSIVLLLRQAAHPRVTELGRIPGTDYFADRVRHPENEQTPGVLVVRCESALLYFNIDHVRDRILHLLSGRVSETRLLIFFLGQVPRVDLAGAAFFEELRKTLAARGIVLQLAEPHGEVRDALRRFGFEREYGPLETGRTVHAILSEWRAADETAHAAII